MNRPFFLLFCIVVALSFAPLDAAARRGAPTIADQAQAFGELNDLVRRYYYEDVNQVDLYDGAIEGYLSRLDPHSTYISPEELRKTQERLEGAFEGIGIYFEIIDDFLTVLSPIEGSPASAVGLQPGDRIIKIDGVSAVAIKIVDVEGRLKGPKGSKVRVSVQREGHDELLEYDIVRDRIRVPSVRYAFMLDSDVGYVKVDRFSGRTDDELAGALEQLEEKGMRRLVLDLRNNGGGFLEQAIAVCDQLFDPGRLVVYTEGRRRGSRQDHFSKTEPLVAESVPMIVLVNSRSASASEIVAGAVQDFDRGLIVGRTTFGKGLVQKQYGLGNGGAVLLTVARYFTPSGRPIQRPFSDNRLAYLEAGHDEYDPNSDTQTDKAIYYTEILAREVYGSGGITPDVTVQSGTLSAFERRLISESLVLKFATEQAANLTREYDDFDAFFRSFNPGRKALSRFRKFLSTHAQGLGEGWQRSFRQSELFIKGRLRREIAQIRWGMEAMGRVTVDNDKVVRQAVEQFHKALALLDSRAFHRNQHRAAPETERAFDNVR